MSPKQVIVNPRKTTALVKKAEDLVYARYELPELSLKIMSSVIAMLRTDETEFAELYVLRVSDWKELSGRTGRSVYEDLKKAVVALMDTPIEIERPHGGFLILNWLSEAEWVPEAGEVEVRIAPKLKPYLLELRKKFLEYGLENILPLKSTYVIRLYELLKHEYNKISRFNGQKAVMYELNLEQLRERFKIPESYQYSSHIKKLIIDKAQKQFAEKTDITFTYTEKKRGRAVERLEITIRENDRSGSGDHSKTRRAFVAWIRQNYVNREIIRTTDKTTGGEISLSVAPDGTLYDLYANHQINASRADEIWSSLYERHKNGSLKLTEQPSLF